MNALAKLSILLSLVRAKLFGRRMPIAISWMITRRCNYACQYCNECSVADANELNTGQVLSIITKLRKAGVKIISFTGGEPLLRDDIGEIIKYCADHQIITRLNSNGVLVPARIEELKYLEAITLSVDGPEEVNDAVRRRGAFRAVLQAAEAASQHGIKIGFLTVLSSGNLDLRNINFLLGMAESFNAKITFQPASSTLLRGQGRNPAVPPISEYRKTIDLLIDLKKKNASIGNSLAGLHHLRFWPEKRPMRCAGEFIFRRIDPDGNLMYCGVCEKPHGLGNCLSEDPEKLLLNTSPTVCDFCWCAERVELNHAFFGDLEAIRNYMIKNF